MRRWIAVLLLTMVGTVPASAAKKELRLFVNLGFALAVLTVGMRRGPAV